MAGLKRSPVVDLLHRSGECNCGAYAEPGELAEMKVWDITRPTYEWLMDLQTRVMAAGFPWGWEEGPPKWWAEKNAGQKFMLGYDEPSLWADQPLCHNCNVRKSA